MRADSHRRMRDVCPACGTRTLTDYDLHQCRCTGCGEIWDDNRAFSETREERAERYRRERERRAARSRAEGHAVREQAKVYDCRTEQSKRCIEAIAGRAVHDVEVIGRGSGKPIAVVDYTAHALFVTMEPSEAAAAMLAAAFGKPMRGLPWRRAGEYRKHRPIAAAWPGGCKIGPRSTLGEHVREMVYPHIERR